MDVLLLSRMIKELVLENDRVSLPGLGVFVCEYVPASFSDKGFVINPPYKRIYFRSKKEDDGLLVSFYAGKNGVDMDVAEKFVEDAVSDIRNFRGWGSCARQRKILCFSWPTRIWIFILTVSGWFRYH